MSATGRVWLRETVVQAGVRNLVMGYDGQTEGYIGAKIFNPSKGNLAPLAPLATPVLLRLCEGCVNTLQLFNSEESICFRLSHLQKYLECRPRGATGLRTRP